MVFGRKRAETGDAEEHVARVLERARRLAGERPAAALRELHRLAGETYPLVTFGGPYHEPFARLVRTLLGWDGEPPEVAARSWSSWAAPPALADVVTFLEGRAEPVVYLFEPRGGLSRGAVAEIEALRALVEDPELVMVALGEADALLRRELVLRVAPSAPPHSTEVLQEIARAARRSGLRSLSILG